MAIPGAQSTAEYSTSYYSLSPYMFAQNVATGFEDSDRKFKCNISDY